MESDSQKQQPIGETVLLVGTPRFGGMLLRPCVLRLSADGCQLQDKSQKVLFKSSFAQLEARTTTQGGIVLSAHDRTIRLQGLAGRLDSIAKPLTWAITADSLAARQIAERTNKVFGAGQANKTIVQLAQLLRERGVAVGGQPYSARRFYGRALLWLVLCAIGVAIIVRILYATGVFDY